MERQKIIYNRRVDILGEVVERNFKPGNFIDLATLTLKLNDKKEIKFTESSIFDGDTGRDGYTVPLSRLVDLNNNISLGERVKVSALDEGKRGYAGLDAKVLE